MTDHGQHDGYVEAYTDGYVDGWNAAWRTAATPTCGDMVIRWCTCGVLAGGVRDPRPNCEVHGGQ